MDCTVHGVTKSQTRWSNYYSSLNRVRRPEGGALMPWGGSRAQKEETLLLFSSNNSGREKSWTLFTIALPYYFFPSIKAFFFPCYVGPWTWLAIFQFSSVAHSCLTLCDPMDCSMPGFPVHHQLPELTQIHVYQVGDAIPPSHPLSSPPSPAFNLSQHQGLFQWVSSSYQVAKVLEFQCQHQSFQWIFRTDFL